MVTVCIAVLGLAIQIVRLLANEGLDLGEVGTLCLDQAARIEGALIQ